MDGEGQPTEAKIAIEFKKCATCGLVKPASEFSRSKRAKDGLYWECKSCKRERDRKDYQMHKDKRLASAKEWKIENKKKVQESRERYKKRRLERERELRAERRQKRIEESGLKPWEPPLSNDIRDVIKKLAS